MTGGVLVVGLGSPDAGDDAVGPLVADAVAQLGLAGVRVLTHSDPTDLPLLLRECATAVVVDAVVSGASVGSVVVLDGSGPLPNGGASGTHDFGLASGVELARALGTLPPRLVVVGVEGAAFAPGDPMSDAVAAAIPDAVAAVVDLVGVSA